MLLFSAQDIPIQVPSVTLSHAQGQNDFSKLNWNTPYSGIKGNSTYSIRQSLFDEIAMFSSFDDGWLGTGAKKIPDAVIERVRSTVRSLERVERLPNPEMTPNENGTISMEWECIKGAVYIEFGRTRISGFIKFKDAPSVYFKDVGSLQSSFYEEIRDLLYSDLQPSSIAIQGAAFESYALA